MDRIGCGRGIGGALRHTLQGEDFVRFPGDDRLILTFKEGQGTKVRDKSPCGNDGIFGAGAAAPTWKRNSLYFDGGDYVVLTGITHGISTGEFTLCFSISGLPDNTVIWGQQTTQFIIINRSDSINIYSVATGYDILTDTGISAIKPLIFQVTRDGSDNSECYVNGKSSNKGLTSAGDFTYDGISSMKLGSNWWGEKFLIGTMYSFRILNKCLSGIECQQEYLANKFSNN